MKMKNIFLLLVVLIPSICISQDLPLKMIIHCEKVDHHSYILLMNVAIRDGWHVYAKADTALGIDPLTIRLGSNNLELSEDESDSKPIQIVDSLFGNKLLSVYTLENVFQRIIKLSQQTKSIVVTITGFASNQRKVIHLNISRIVNLDKGIIQ